MKQQIYWDFKQRLNRCHKCLNSNCNTKIYEDAVFCKKCLKLNIITRLKIYSRMKLCCN